MIVYSDDKINSEGKINELPNKTLNQQKLRKALLKIYKKMKLPVLCYPQGQKEPELKGWTKASIKELWNNKNLPINNLGLRLDDYMVIDIDEPEKAIGILQGIEIPLTAIVYRGERDPLKVLKWEERGHIYFKRPEWLKWKNGRKFPELGIELRTGIGQQNVIPDSIHPDGTEYKWYEANMFRDGVAEFPKAIFDKIAAFTNIDENEDEADINIITEDEATDKFYKNKKILDQLVTNHNFTCEKGDYNQAGQTLSNGLNYYGYCPRAERHSKKEGNSSPTEFMIHLSYEGSIKKYCHHTHCKDIYKEKLTDLFSLSADFSFLDAIGIEDKKDSMESGNTTSAPDPYEELRDLATQIKDVRNGDESNKNEKCFVIIVNYLEDNGLFIKDKNDIHYYFDKKHKQTFQINPEDQDFAAFLHKIGIAINEPIAKIITNRLKGHCHITGLQVDVKKFCYYDKKNFTLYLDLRNGQNQILKITPDCIHVIDNGTDGIMFNKSKESSIEIRLPISPTTTKFEEILLNRINFDEEESNLSKDEQQLLFEIFFMSVFFETIFPTKPLLLVFGVKGSGKSFSLRAMGKLLFGEDWDLSSATNDNERDLKVASLYKSFLGIDNADSRIKWMNDFLAKMATGEQFEEREMRTNNKYIVMKPRCFIGLTARTPKFRRDDIADRLIILSVKPLEDNYIPESDLLEELEQNRQVLWMEIIYKLQGILKQLKVNNSRKYITNFRMADFYSFACKTVGEEQVKDIFKKLQHQQYNFSLEEDPLFELLQMYVEEEEDEGGFFTGKELFNKIRVIAENNRIIFPFKTVMSFTTKLRHLWKNLREKFNCTIEKKKDRLTYCFKNKDKN